MTDQRERSYWMDAIRGIAVLLVIVQHSVTVPLFDGFPALRAVEILNDAMAPYRVPLLLALSGVLLHVSLNKGLPAYARGKLRNIAWPLLLWTPVTLALSPQLWGSVAGLVGPRHLWYLVTLLFCYAVGVAALRISAGWLCVGLIAIYSIPGVSEIGLAFPFWYGAYFMFGAWLGPHLVRWQRAPYWVALILGAIAIAWAWAAGTGIELLPALEFAASLSGIAVLLWLGGRLPRMSWAEWAGRRSIVFYVVHVPAMLITLRLIGDPDLLGPAAITGLMIVVGVIAALLLTGKWAAFLFAWPAKKQEPKPLPRKRSEAPTE